ncbi:MAG TPA: glycosyltransferase family A protein [Chitinophaga sp.]|uniref:glycosyltransferase family 2 protein n=1 Tax=Chitinophaga sp. TaxID=1869181 RepID=UPI002B5FC439|nr:glycosyltransferase family A protein [Chitinophaga sp.]HVI45110.1 glycosyltransferase family A protein [Chitinophaga sp.]
MNHRISVCITCMNRQHHLEKTLPENIRMNSDYPDAEFIILDYHSAAPFFNWLKEEYPQELKTGRLRYLRTEMPDYFHHSHAKNMAAVHASGEIICCVDADNFIGPGFLAYVNDAFCQDAAIFLTVDHNSTSQDLHGRICMWRHDFAALQGYDERMNGYGYEDIDLVKRLEKLGRKPLFINNEKYLHALNHGIEERIGNTRHARCIETFYIRYIDPALSELLIINNDGTYEKGLVKPGGEHNNLFTFPQPVTATLEHGAVRIAENGVLLDAGDSENTLLLETTGINLRYTTGKTPVFYKITDEAYARKLVLIYSCMVNYQQMTNDENYTTTNAMLPGSGAVVAYRLDANGLTENVNI